jgi:hypothetical protein
MKLLFCLICRDIFNLSSAHKACQCGRVEGMYINDVDAVYSGGVPLGIANTSFIDAVIKQPENGLGKEFTAFVIPKDCPTFKEDRPAVLKRVPIAERIQDAKPAFASNVDGRQKSHRG